MADRHGPSNGDPRQPHAVEVLRIKGMDPYLVRFLSPTYGGCFVHWERDRSRYCRGADCPAARHRLDRQWKGYAAIEVYLEASELWCPAVLEISEHLELDLRGVCLRGQMWSVFREKGTKKKPGKVHGRILDVAVDPDLPDPFDVVPVLRNLFHEDDVVLNVANPLVGRPIVQARNAAKPPTVAKTPELLEPMSAEEREKRRNIVSELKRKFAGHTAINGKADRQPKGGK
jgi:hypothetical protein